MLDNLVCLQILLRLTQLILGIQIDLIMNRMFG